MKKIFLGFLLSVASIIVHSAPPETLDYQGYLADSSGVPLSGTYDLSIKLYKLATGGSDLWNQTSTVTLVNGRFSLILDGTGINPFPDEAFDQQLYVGISVATDPEMTPRQALTSVPSAFKALNAITADNADLLDGLQANEIIDAASDEVRTPISSLPFSINQSGSYYVTQNLDGSSGGIDVNVDNVTIDLMGFTLDGGGSINDYGIFLNGHNQITVRNGVVTGFGFSGVHNNSTASTANVVEHITSVNNGINGSYTIHAGISLNGSNSLIENCIAKNNGSRGLKANAHSIIKNSISENNGTTGILVGNASQVIQSISVQNGQDGIVTGSTSIVKENTVMSNGSTGILTSGISSIIDNNVYNNSSFGIVSSAANKVVGNNVSLNNQSASNNRGGISVSSDSLIKDNVVDSNLHTGIYIAGSDNILRNNHIADTLDVGGDSFCLQFISNDNAVIGNTITNCTTAIVGSVPPASRLIDNLSW